MIEKIERFSFNIRSWQDLKNDEKRSMPTA